MNVVTSLHSNNHFHSSTIQQDGLDRFISPFIDTHFFWLTSVKIYEYKHCRYQHLISRRRLKENLIQENERATLFNLQINSVRSKSAHHKLLDFPRILEAARMPLITAPSTLGLAQKSPHMANLLFLSHKHFSSPPIVRAGKALPLQVKLTIYEEN